MAGNCQVRSKRKSPTLLSEHKAGERVKVIELLGEKDFKNKIISQGIIPGMVVEIVSATKGGSYVLTVNQSRVILGNGVVDKILIK